MNKYKTGDLLVSLDYQGNIYGGFTHLVIESPSLNVRDYKFLTHCIKGGETIVESWSVEAVEQKCFFQKLA